MIYKLKGRLEKTDNNKVIIETNGISYEINTSRTIAQHLKNSGKDIVELIIYDYFNIDKNRGIPVMVGFLDELEKDFFEEFISVSGVGPKAALKAFDKPVAAIAAAIEEGDMGFLTTLAGIGKQRAKQIVAHLQGKVGRFALIKKEKADFDEPVSGQIIEEARKILKRLQYGIKEAEDMIKKALATKPQIENVEDLLNEIYRQRK